MFQLCLLVPNNIGVAECFLDKLIVSSRLGLPGSEMSKGPDTTLCHNLLLSPN